MASPPVAAALEGESGFGQRVDLTSRIREILSNYPEGPSILKELIQNAVRALATTWVQFNQRNSSMEVAGFLTTEHPRGQLQESSGPAGDNAEHSAAMQCTARGFASRFSSGGGVTD